jgi:hypothetical protein
MFIYIDFLFLQNITMNIFRASEIRVSINVHNTKTQKRLLYLFRFNFY